MVSLKKLSFISQINLIHPSITTFPAKMTLNNPRKAIHNASMLFNPNLRITTSAVIIWRNLKTTTNNAAQISTTRKTAYNNAMVA